MSSVGRFTAWRTINMVTRPAEGIPAAPIAAAVAVKLVNEYKNRQNKKQDKNKQTKIKGKKTTNKLSKKCEYLPQYWYSA